MTSRWAGKVATWKDDQGYGFIRPDDGSSDVFFHVSEIANPQFRPTENDAVTYTLGTDDKGRPQAIELNFDREPATPLMMSLYVVGCYFVLLAVLPFFSQLPWWVCLASVGLSLATFAVYWLDKFQAQQAGRRVPETTLHFLELFGGWPGALVAQRYIRHKNRKASYQVTFWICVGLNLVGLGWVCVNGVGNLLP